MFALQRESPRTVAFVASQGPDLEAVRAKVRRELKEQGKAAEVTDPVALGRLRVLFRSAMRSTSDQQREYAGRS